MVQNITILLKNIDKHIDAGVTFSLGLQPTSDHEFKFLHARRMKFIHCP